MFAKLGQGVVQYVKPCQSCGHAGGSGNLQVEPYVISTEIYSVPPYTGSSGWMYRLGLEAILGITKVGNALIINPCIPGQWVGFKVDYRFGATHYKINAENPCNVNQGIREVILKESPVNDKPIPLVDDGHPHEVRVVME